jgi:hypothetical protein
MADRLDHDGYGDLAVGGRVTDGETRAVIVSAGTEDRFAVSPPGPAQRRSPVLSRRPPIGTRLLRRRGLSRG